MWVWVFFPLCQFKINEIQYELMWILKELMEDSVILEVFSNINASDLWDVSKGLELNKQASANVGHPSWSSRFSCWIEEENIFYLILLLHRGDF